MVEVFFDGPTVPPGLFKAFEDIPHTRGRAYTSPMKTWEDLVAIMPNRDQTMRWGLMEGVDDLKDVELRYAPLESCPQRSLL